MFIGGLNWETTDESLRNYFSQFGKITSSSIMRDPSGRSRGFAFLTFEDPASVNSVVVKEHTLDGKLIDPKRAVPRAEHVKTSKIFVGGLAPNVTNATLKDFFNNYGKVIDAHIMLDRETSRNKGFAFVTFAEEADVMRAMEATGTVIEGRAIEVKKAQPRNVRDGLNQNETHQIGSHMGNGPQSSKYINNQGYSAGGGRNNAMGGGAGAGGAGGMGMNMPFMPMMGGGNAMGGGAFDPQAMALMYQRMMMMMNPMMNMGMMNQKNGAAGGMGMMNPGMGGAMPNMGGMNFGGAAINPAMMGNMNRNLSPTSAEGGAASGSGTGSGRPPAPPNAPRGPAAMRNNQQGGGSAPTGPAQPARYSTQGQARSRPY